MAPPTTFRRFLRSRAALATAAFLSFALTPVSGGTRSKGGSTAPNLAPQRECRFSDGSTITFGRRVPDSGQAGSESWRTGDYDATTLHVSERMLIPPLDSPLEIPAGSYTLFVKDKGNPPWTLIVSRKIGEWGMPYPGEQYDLGRTYLGSDVQPSINNFTIGCMQGNGAPVFVWMQSGRLVGMAKIMAVNTKKGRSEYLWH
jgi:Protein of unknown function (DUF2911)